MMMTMPISRREKYSDGPKARANRAMGGATSVIPTTPMVPAMKEPKAAMPSAGPALPVLGHLVPVEAGDDRCGLARGC